MLLLSTDKSVKLNLSAKPEAVARRIRVLAPASAHGPPDLGEPASA